MSVCDSHTAHFVLLAVEENAVQKLEVVCEIFSLPWPKTDKVWNLATVQTGSEEYEGLFGDLRSSDGGTKFEIIKVFAIFIMHLMIIFFKFCVSGKGVSDSIPDHVW